MRFSATAATAAVALLAGSVHADAQSVLSEASSSASSVATEASSAVESATSSAIEVPTFTVSPPNSPQFTTPHFKLSPELLGAI